MSDAEDVVENDEEPGQDLRVRLRVVEAAVLLCAVLSLVQGIIASRNAKRLQSQIDDVRQETGTLLDPP